MNFKRLAKAISAGLASLMVSGCALALPVEGPTPVIDTSISAEVKPFYEQSITWLSCASGKAVCGEFKVPVDWSKPDGQTLKLSVAYRAADNAKPLGSIIFNPGGPGSSATSWLLDSAEQIGTAELRKHFNLVGFDPRGVGDSQPSIKCLDAKGTDELLYGDTGLELGSPADISETRRSMKVFIDSCIAGSGPGLGFIDTVSAAKDMDVLRALMGDSKLNYLGFSYGTYLGATYAALFADRVGRMVLDGAIDPTISDEQQSVFQLAGFDQALRNYLADCLGSSDCPFSGTVEKALSKIKALLLAIEKNPLPTSDGRELTIWGAITGLIMPLYSQSYWPALSQGFAEALAGDGSTLIQLADAYNDRDEKGEYLSNLMEANFAINCADSRAPSDQRSMIEQNARMLKASPTLGRYWAWGALGCEQWPYPVSEKPKTWSALTANPILVVGTTGDPATPYSQAVSLASKVLGNARLLTFFGEGHTAYGKESRCVNNAVDSYLIRNVVPTEDPNC
jgi:pimeloyl-ACP methyl ester carboxylesterase